MHAWLGSTPRCPVAFCVSALTVHRCLAAPTEALAGQVALKSTLEDFTTTADTLVVYVYSNTNPEYQRNFHFFLKHGIKPDDNHHYIIVIQDVLVSIPPPLLASLVRKAAQHACSSASVIQAPHALLYHATAAPDP